MLGVGKHVGQDGDITRADEVIGYVVVEAGSGTVDGTEYAAGVGTDTVAGVDNYPPYRYPLSGLASATGAVVSQAGMDGGTKALRSTPRRPACWQHVATSCSSRLSRGCGGCGALVGSG